MMRILGVAVALAGLVAAVGCGGDEGSAARPQAGESVTSAAATTAAAAPGVVRDASRQATSFRRRGKTIKVMRTRYGRILVDGRGRAAYLFTREQGTTPRCYGECAKAWPPVYTSGRPRAGDGAHPSLLGRATRRGGRRQVTYDGHPLYYYVHDDEPGEVLCQDVAEFGGTWLVVRPSGRPVR
jgi:predicted lipoprotein with Yx(FWY)xxD motif